MIDLEALRRESRQAELEQFQAFEATLAKLSEKTRTGYLLCTEIDYLLLEQGGAVQGPNRWYYTCKLMFLKAKAVVGPRFDTGAKMSLADYRLATDAIHACKEIVRLAPTDPVRRYDHPEPRFYAMWALLAEEVRQMDAWLTASRDQHDLKLSDPDDFCHVEYPDSPILADEDDVPGAGTATVYGGPLHGQPVPLDLNVVFDANAAWKKAGGDLAMAPGAPKS